MTVASNQRIRGKIVIYLQFGLIVLLFLAISSEYQANQYQQDWISRNVSWLQYLLSGYLSAALVGVLIGAGFLLAAEIARWRRRKGVLRTRI